MTGVQTCALPILCKINIIHDIKTAPVSYHRNRGGSLALFVLFQALTQLLAGVLDRSLSSGQTCDRHTEGRAADIVQTNLVAELDAGRISTVLAADAQTQVGTGLTAIMCSHLDQLADTDLVQMLERIALVDLVQIGRASCRERVSSPV